MLAQIVVFVIIIYFPLLIPNYSFLLLLKIISWLREHRHLRVTVKTNKIKKRKCILKSLLCSLTMLTSFMLGFFFISIIYFTFMDVFEVLINSVKSF